MGIAPAAIRAQYGVGLLDTPFSYHQRMPTTCQPDFFDWGTSSQPASDSHGNTNDGEG